MNALLLAAVLCSIHFRNGHTQGAALIYFRHIALILSLCSGIQPMPGWSVHANIDSYRTSWPCICVLLSDCYSGSLCVFMFSTLSYNYIINLHVVLDEGHSAAFSNQASVYIEIHHCVELQLTRNLDCAYTQL